MIEVLFAVAFSAAPLTLYVPPVRSLNLFVETMEYFLKETVDYTFRNLPVVQLGFRRVRASLLRLIQSQSYVN